MIFNSFQFIWLFPLIFAAYWISYKCNSRRFCVSKYLLLAISYGVYIQWSPIFGLVLFAITLLTYLFAILIANHPAKRKFLIWTGSLLTLSPLLLFKYFNFVNKAGASALQWIGIDVAPPSLTWVVPLGLSFYTFQALGYLFDVYRSKIKAETDFPDYMLFVSFFPQIFCGPISTAGELMPQIKNPKPFSYSFAISGLRLMLWGMFLKVVLADRAGIYVDSVFSDYESFNGTSNLLASLLYTLQIYGDFAGYSYIAIGTARLLGIGLPRNFNRPYLSESVSEFWKRWNMTLTRWLTTNVYIPLGGSRRGRGRTYVNILVTFLVSGIWHGANWTFIFWGVLHGAAQTVEKFFGLNKLKSHGIVRIIRCFATFMFVNLAWIYFRMPSLEDANHVIGKIFTEIGRASFVKSTIAYFLIAFVIVAFVEIGKEFNWRILNKTILGNKALRWSAYLILTMMVVGMGVLDTSQFIYLAF